MTVYNSILRYTYKGTLVLFLFLLPVVLVSIPPVGMAEEKAKLLRVEPSNVCMTNNKDMGKPQMPVTVEDKIYYGCCKMCAANLSNNTEPRYSIDPVTGKKVDKATAVIGAKPNGEVLYFESEESFDAFQKALAAGK